MKKCKQNLSGYIPVCAFVLSCLPVFSYGHTGKMNEKLTTASVAKVATPVHYERFDSTDVDAIGGNDHCWNYDASASPYRKVSSDLTLTNCYQGHQCIRCGDSRRNGVISIKVSSSNVKYITFRIAGMDNYTDEGIPIVVKVNGNPVTVTTKAKKNKFTEHRINIGSVTSPVTITFSAQQDGFPFYVDDVIFYKDLMLSNLSERISILLLSGDYTQTIVESLNKALASRPSLTSLDCRMATFSTSSSLKPANPNCIIYANKGQVTNTTNTVTSKVCNDLKINEEYPFKALFSFTATNVNYTRSSGSELADYVSTACLPFSLSSEALKKTGVTSVSELSTFDNVNGKLLFMSADSMKAKFPYLITTNISQPFEQLKDVNAYIEATTVELVSKDRMQFNGCLHETKVKASNDSATQYGFSQGKFVRVSEECTLPAFRAYLSIPTNLLPHSFIHQSLAVAFENPTAITNNKMDEAPGSCDVYNLQGKLLLKNVNSQIVEKTLGNGLYIIDKRKVLINH